MAFFLEKIGDAPCIFITRTYGNVVSVSKIPTRG